MANEKAAFLKPDGQKVRVFCKYDTDGADYFLGLVEGRKDIDVLLGIQLLEDTPESRKLLNEILENKSRTRELVKEHAEKFNQIEPFQGF